MDNVQDMTLMGLLGLSMLLLVVGVPFRHVAPPPNTAGPFAEPAAVAPGGFDPRDLDQDGYVTWWEEHATGEQLLSFSKIGYPFEQILQMGEPTKSVKKAIEVSAFVAAVNSTNADGTPWVSFFHHPKLIERFVAKYTNPETPLQLRGIYLTHDRYLAMLLTDEKDETKNVICLEKLSASDEAILAKLEGESKDKNARKKIGGKNKNG